MTVTTVEGPGSPMMSALVWSGFVALAMAGGCAVSDGEASDGTSCVGKCDSFESANPGSAPVVCTVRGGPRGENGDSIDTVICELDVGQTNIPLDGADLRIRPSASDSYFLRLDENRSASLGRVSGQRGYPLKIETFVNYGPSEVLGLEDLENGRFVTSNVVDTRPAEGAEIRVVAELAQELWTVRLASQLEDSHAIGINGGPSLEPGSAREFGLLVDRGTTSTEVVLYSYGGRILDIPGPGDYTVDAQFNLIPGISLPPATGTSVASCELDSTGGAKVLSCFSVDQPGIGAVEMTIDSAAGQRVIRLERASPADEFASFTIELDQLPVTVTTRAELTGEIAGLLHDVEVHDRWAHTRTTVNEGDDSFSPRLAFELRDVRLDVEADVIAHLNVPAVDVFFGAAIRHLDPTEFSVLARDASKTQSIVIPAPVGQPVIIDGLAGSLGGGAQVDAELVIDHEFEHYEVSAEGFSRRQTL